MRTFLAILAMLTALNAHAGKEAGNGGDAVVCSSGRIEILDVYEARVLRNLEYRWKVSGTPDAMATAALEPLKTASPHRYARMHAWAESFMSEARFVHGVTLEDIPDSKEIFLPNGCRIQQIAIQKAPQFSADGRYLIDGDLWDRLDVSNRAALVLHEISYREAIEEGHTNSISARYFASLLGSGKLDTVTTPEQFLAIAKEVNFDRITFNGWEIKRSGMYFYPSGALRWITLEGNPVIEVNGIRFTVKDRIMYYEKGGVEYVENPFGSLIEGPGFTATAISPPTRSPFHGVDFNEKGNLTGISAAQGEFLVQGQKVALTGEYAADSDWVDNGGISCHTFNGTTHCEPSFGHSVPLPARPAYFRFLASGAVAGGNFDSKFGLNLLGKKLDCEGAFSLHEDGSVKKALLVGETLPFLGQPRRIEGEVELTDQGTLIAATLKDVFEATVQGKKLKLTGYTGIDPKTGALHYVTLTHKESLRAVGGYKEDYQAGWTLELDPAGLVAGLYKY